MTGHSLKLQLRSLAESGSQFILVGSLAAVLHGAPVQTYDVDIVYALDAGNVRKMLLFCRCFGRRLMN